METRERKTAGRQKRADSENSGAAKNKRCGVRSLFAEIIAASGYGKPKWRIYEKVKQSFEPSLGERYREVVASPEGRLSFE